MSCSLWSHHRTTEPHHTTHIYDMMWFMFSDITMLCGWLVLAVAALGQAQQFYTVLAPDTIRPNNNYLVAISVEGTQGDLQVSPN